jgi:choline dehydrogenase-like flavoprotein
LNDRETAHPAGKLLGGSSAINGLFWTPPSPAGIDAWAKLGNPNWTWRSLKPYFHKSVSLPAAEGESEWGPIKVSHTTLLEDGSTNPLAQAWIDAHQVYGYGPQRASLPEAGIGSVGTRLCTMTIDPVTGTRRSSDSTYGLIAKERKNVRIVTKATVRKVLFTTHEGGSLQATGVEVDIRGATCTVHAAKEVILAAGALHTPKILELSGVGDRKRLEDLGIDVVLEQQGVGAGLQNHVMAVLPFLLKETPEAASVPSGGHAFSFTQPEQNDIEEILAQYAGSSNHEAVTKSLIEQVNEGSEFNILGTYPGNFGALATILSYPFSRGSVHISSKNPEDHSTIDPRYFSHPLDIELLARQVQSSQKLLSSPHFAPFVQGPETADLDTIKTQLRESLGAAAHHACGTAAMLPREAGGVVDQDLKVHGTTNLRIADASVFPLIPSGNPISTVYAVAECAADIVLGKAE